MREKGTSIVLLDPLKQKLKSLRGVWGTKKNIVNAALWLFCDSEPKDQLRAVQAVAELQKNQETPKGVASSSNGASDAVAAGSDAALADAQAHPRTGRRKQRSA